MLKSNLVHACAALLFLSLIVHADTPTLPPDPVIEYLDDGLTHLVNDDLYQGIQVRLDYYNTSNTGTHLELEENGILTELRAYNNSTVTIHGGGIEDRLMATGDSSIEILGGSVQDLHTYQSSTTAISSGVIHSTVFTYETSHVEISGGSIGNNIQSQHSSMVTIRGGIVENYIHAYDNSIITINGGTIQNTIISHDDGIYNISGGDIHSSFQAYDGTLYLFGTDFSCNGIDLQYGDNLRDFANPHPQVPEMWLIGSVSGILQDHTALNTSFAVWTDSDAAIIIIPEPSSLSFLIVGSILSSRKKRSSLL